MLCYDPVTCILKPAKIVINIVLQSDHGMQDLKGGVGVKLILIFLVLHEKKINKNYQAKSGMQE